METEYLMLCSARDGSMDDYARLRNSRQGLVLATLRQQSRALVPQDVEDLEQEVWIAVWHSLPRFEGRSKFDTWLVGITRNVLRAWLRKNRCQGTDVLQLCEEDDLVRTDSRDDPLFQRLAVSEEIHRLPEREQEVIVLRYFMQMTDPEIADRLQLPLGTVKGRLRSGLSRLREDLRNALLGNMNRKTSEPIEHAAGAV